MPAKSLFIRVEPADEFFEVLPMITGEFESFVRGRGDDCISFGSTCRKIRPATWTGKRRPNQVRLRCASSAAKTSASCASSSTIPAPDAVSECGLRESGGARGIAQLALRPGEHRNLIRLAGLQRRAGHLSVSGLPGGCPAETLPSVVESLQPSDDYNIILTTRPRGSIPTALWACSYFVFIGPK